METHGCLQIRAMFLKQWYQVKRQKLALCCLGTSPLFVLLLVFLLNSLLKEINMLSLKKVDELPLLPFYVYPMNLMRTPTVSALLAGKNRMFDGRVLHDYGYLADSERACNSTCQEAIEDMLDSPPFLYTYSYNGSRHPIFYRNPDLKNIKDLNKEATREIQILQSTPMNRLWFDNHLPDSFILFQQANNSGISAHMQVNNLVRKQYHRENGFAFMRTFTERDVGVGEKQNQTVPTIVATEGFISLINMFSNMFIQQQSNTQGSMPKILGVISPTADSNLVLTVSDTFYGIICTNAVPVALTPRYKCTDKPPKLNSLTLVALSLGFPIMLSTLVSDKEQKVASLFRVNGLREKNHWLGFYAFYIILLSISSTAFWLLGKAYVEISFFMRTNTPVMLMVLTCWNLAQTSQALLLSKVINSSGTAMTVGYIFAIMSAFFLGGLSLWLFQTPNYLPWYFYIVPQTPFIRFLYVLLANSAEHRFLTSFKDLQGELFLCVILLPALAVSYGIIGIKGKDFLNFLDGCLFSKAKLRYRRWRGNPPIGLSPRETASIYASVDNIREYEQLEPATSMEMQGAVVDPSVRAYVQEKLHLDPQNNSYPLIAQNIFHQYPTPSGGNFYALQDVTLALKRGKKHRTSYFFGF